MHNQSSPLSKHGLIILFLGSLSALFAVGLGAFGAHGLKDHLDPDKLDVYSTANLYHFLHSLGMILAGILYNQLHKISLCLAAWCMAAGILLFSGLLYLQSTGLLNAFFLLVPLGGMLFMAGWALMAWSALIAVR